MILYTSQMIDYLIFWWQSSNEHGVHSPYVFRYLTRGLYGLSKKYEASKPYRLALSTIDYFSMSSVYCSDPKLSLKINAVFPHVKLNSTGLYDMVIYRGTDEIDYSRLHKDTILLILKPQRKEVRSFLASDRFCLVIDFYNCLFLQNRTEQRRQNFILRY